MTDMLRTGTRELYRGETKRRVSQISCEMQRDSDLLRPDYTKERNKLERGHSFGV